MANSTEYQRQIKKKSELMDKLKQLTVYRKGLEGYIYSLEYFSLPAETQERINKEFVLINNWTQLNKDLKIM